MALTVFPTFSLISENINKMLVLRFHPWSIKYFKMYSAPTQLGNAHQVWWSQPYWHYFSFTIINESIAFTVDLEKSQTSSSHNGKHVTEFDSSRFIISLFILPTRCWCTNRQTHKSTSPYHNTFYLWWLNISCLFILHLLVLFDLCL